MKINSIIYEARRNSESNKRLSAYEFVSQYKDNPKAYLHTTNVLKVGIYPKSSDSHDSPIGIYAYRIMDIWEECIEKWNTGDYKKGISFLPYIGGSNLFILESDIDPDISSHYSNEDLYNDCQKLKIMFKLNNAEMEDLSRAAETNLNYRDNYISHLWGITKALSADAINIMGFEFDEYTSIDTKKWNSILRKLGYVGFNDPGRGWIHGAERSQALFLTSSAFKIIDLFQSQLKPKNVKVNNVTYKDGRLPKELHMKGVDSVTFYNATPEDFKKVRKWTIDYVDINQFRTFCRFLPWNAEGIIGTISITTSEVFGLQTRDIETLNKMVIPKNIKINAISLMTRDPFNKLKNLRPDFPVDKIYVSKFADNYNIDNLPEILKNKLVFL